MLSRYGAQKERHPGSCQRVAKTQSTIRSIESTFCVTLTHQSPSTHPMRLTLRSMIPPRLPHSEERSRLGGCERRKAAWKQNVERKEFDALRRRWTEEIARQQYPNQSPTFAASPYPARFAQAPYIKSTILFCTIPEGGDINEKSRTMRSAPLVHQVVGAVLKRPESLRAEIQPRPPRFPSLRYGTRVAEKLREENDTPTEDGGEDETGVT
ncbi:hypothetical protein EI94DRAFT_1699525 [Lactarius quietus]|nr:hypothetical protein EI94DRAFT_1699525 [Lactarius quietus]